MVNPFVCGSFQPEIDDESSSSSPCSTPRKSRYKNDKNPYSKRGLDKFSALLAELEEKRQKIYSQNDSQEVLFVRFVYKNSDECVPVVVKQKDKKEDKINKQVMQSLTPCNEKETKRAKLEASDGKAKKKKSLEKTVKMNRWKRPSYYLTPITILILFLLAVFGRSVAILCTSIGWYFVPTLKEISNSNYPTKKKKITRRLSDNRMISDGLLSSPKRNNNPRGTKDSSNCVDGQPIS